MGTRVVTQLFVITAGLIMYSSGWVQYGWWAGKRTFSDDPVGTLVLVEPFQRENLYLSAVNLQPVRDGDITIVSLKSLGNDTFNVTGSWTATKKASFSPWYTFLHPPPMRVPGNVVGFYNPGPSVVSYDLSSETDIVGYHGISAASLTTGNTLVLGEQSVSGYSQRKYAILFYWLPEQHAYPLWKRNGNGQVGASKEDIPSSIGACRVSCFVRRWTSCRSIKYNVTKQMCWTVQMDEAEEKSTLAADDNWSSETWYESHVDVTVVNNPALASSLEILTDLDPDTCSVAMSPSLVRDTLLILKVPFQPGILPVTLEVSGLDCMDRSRFLAYRYKNWVNTDIFEECDVIPAKPGYCSIRCSCGGWHAPCRTAFLRFRKGRDENGVTLLCEYRAAAIVT